MGRMILSICALVVALGLAGSAQPVQPQQQAPAANQPTKATEKTRQQRPPVLITLAEPEGERQSNQQQTDDDPGGSEPSPWYDLWAQGLMALWALGQLVLTGVGIHYLKRTLEVTREAVEDTGQATIAMLAANEIAARAVDVTREAAEKQLRAYVYQDGVEIKPEPGRVAMNAIFKNWGQTPARGAVIECWLGKGEEPNELVDVEGRSPEFDIPPGGKIAHSFYLTGTPEQIADHQLGRVKTWIHGHLRYTDVAGAAHVLDFCMLYDPPAAVFGPHGRNAST